MFFRNRTQIEAFAAAAARGKFAIYEYDEALIIDLICRGYFSNLAYEVDYVLVSDETNNIGKILRHYGVVVGPTHPFSFLSDYECHSILIHDKKDPLGKFEKVAALGKFDPNNIFVLPEAWETRTRRQDNILEEAYTNADQVGGGLSSKELCAHIINCMERIKDKGTRGHILNLGVHRGWSMHFMAEVRDRLGINCRIYGFDTFDGFPDIRTSHYDGFIQYMKDFFGPHSHPHRDTSYDFVSSALGKFKDIELVEGDIRQTVKLIDGIEVSLALFDMDDYTPTKVALAPVYNSLSQEGFIVHDHFSYPSCNTPGLFGQRQAMVEFLQQYRMFNLSGTNIFMKD